MNDLFKSIEEAHLSGDTFSPDLVLGHYEPRDGKQSLVLGIACHYHDSSVCLVRNGVPVYASEEERFSRRKHDRGFPRQALENCLSATGCSFRDIDLVVFYEEPVLKLRRILTHNAQQEDVLRTKLERQLSTGMLLERDLRVLGHEGPVEYAHHHASHAASAFFPSPFEEAAILTVDAVGEYATCELWHGKGNQLNRVRTLFSYPQSLGMLYSAVTAFLGFKVNNDEYKVMGLASYGEPEYLEKIVELAGPPEPQGFSLDMECFTFDRSEAAPYNQGKFEALFGFPRRQPEGPIEKWHRDLASSLQAYTETFLCALTSSIRRELKLEYLCMAGGVALNCVANERISKMSGFSACFIQPAAGDSGGALGAALLGAHVGLGQPRRESPDCDTYLGPSFSEEVIKGVLDDEFVRYQRFEIQELFEWTARQIAAGRVIGWFQGRMEFGPRALGNRSILADARNPRMQDILNSKVKHRESFRPFAPAVLAERCGEYFDLTQSSPFMLFTAGVRKPDAIPAVTHVDGSARVQTVHKATNPRFHSLIGTFAELTGVPVLINTSFNVRGEPIVCTPTDAFNCFLTTGIDVLVMDNFVVDKEDMDA